ncbi:putative transcriptional regulator [Actinoplanes missouriensis 431]|uniref:Putative transcriptional regulator n=1 Tax=Actinoplanes missouriensis (strain ATCC 14538 / DSM 43046 / CBS 188.64 / JCM 3121 / NBRC 102363 / NCIMB 12654 / NRRL B-3342 / UNCC 431) TaxID=512565 RepID=I0HE60_ACTM4|nr:SMC-Scp complex subunit ScpB [Actinoplanes missouriensis]BAL91297.1 putative transcriptional regulator [Actinoplanes missouriensis 431]
MSSSPEHEDSLAAQAAAWVPPWERRREPDRDFQDAVDAPEDLPEDEPGAEPAPEPTEEELGPELPLPDPVEEAAESADADEDLPEDDEHVPVDAPINGDGPGPQASDDHPGPPAGTPVPVTVPAQGRKPRDGSAASEGGEARTPSVVLDDAELAAALESIMLVVDEPVGELQLAQVMEQPVERIARTLEDVSARYTAAGHGIDLRRVAGGWRLYTRPEYAPYVERFVLDGQSVRLTQAALETLSVVAYKQPVTRSRISAIRGVNCDGVMRTLVTRGLIEECGTEPETGAYLYRTTVLFLEKLGLNSVDQLPPLAPFLPDDVEEVLDASG